MRPCSKDPESGIPSDLNRKYAKNVPTPAALRRNVHRTLHTGRILDFKKYFYSSGIYIFKKLAFFYRVGTIAPWSRFQR
jgi:hypothetical protein